MGGRSFLDKLQGVEFPRMNSATYTARKALHMEHLKQLFRLVAVPREAPEKSDYGDLDFIVCNPIAGPYAAEDLQTLTGAAHCIKSGPVFNLAIPLPSDSAGEVQQKLYYQVDITQCHNQQEFDCFVYFQSYGDLGMILGLVARENGLSLGLHGLKIPKVNEYNMEPFLLSNNFPHIFEFYGLDMDTWNAGFSTVVSIFEWVATSSLYDSRFLQESQHRAHRRRDRKMFQRFLEWVEDRKQQTQKNDASENMRRSNVVEAAKIFFGKKEEYEATVEKERCRRNRKENFNGHLVMEWTGLQGKDVKLVMDEVRKNVDDLQFETISRQDIRNLVLEARERILQISEK